MVSFSIKSLFEWIHMGWYASYPLILCSLVVWAIIFERIIHYRAIGKRLHSFHLNIQNALLKEDFSKVIKMCQDSIYLPTAQVVLEGIEKILSEDSKLKNRWKESMERSRQIANIELKKNLWILGTIASTAPFIGLFGTVVGILRSFFDIAAAGKGGFAVVASGIAEALVATAGGIIVAVIASFSYNAFQNHWSQLVFKVRIYTEEVSELLDDYMK